MGRDGWHMVYEGGTLVHARSMPADFDVVVETTVVGGAGLSKSRIARQVRQDVWRALAGLRGFKPIVTVAEDDGDLIVRAGGHVDGPFPKAHAEMVIHGILHDPMRRLRWVNYARRSE